MHVMLDVFSGRPNPSWELSPKEGSEFLKKILQLKTKDIFQFDSGKGDFGSRGFIVEETILHKNQEDLRYTMEWLM